MQFNIHQTYHSERKENYDLAFIGSGISCTYTLINYIQRLSQQINDNSWHLLKPISVAVLDKSGEFWTGIPYGGKTGKHSLIITALNEFLPELERDRFVSWLINNNDRVLDSLSKRPGILTDKWLKSYEKAIALGDWHQLFIPRYIFGWYLRESVEQLLANASSQGYLQCDLVNAEVLNLKKQESSYEIEFATETTKQTLVAAKVVLAIGSPPNKLSFLEKLEAATNQSDCNVCLISNMYEPSQDINLQTIATALKQVSSSERQVLIIGSNASALETIYSLNNSSETKQLIDKFIVISPNGEFPNRIYDRLVKTNFVPQALVKLSQQEDITAKQILIAVQEDVALVLQQGETIDSTYRIISQEVFNCLNRLSPAEQKQFVVKYGVEIGKFQRRAGKDYLNVIDTLVAQNKLEMIRGKFTKIIDLNNIDTDLDYGVGFEFTSANNQTAIITSPIQVIINCAGFQNLRSSSSILIRNLIEQKICNPNDSLCGIEIDENFEANKNLYLMGPLVAGNINSKFKVWHAESCGRIINLSQQLAEVLI